MTLFRRWGSLFFVGWGSETGNAPGVCVSGCKGMRPGPAQGAGVGGRVE